MNASIPMGTESVELEMIGEYDTSQVSSLRYGF